MTDLASELRDIERKLFEIPDEKVAQLTLLIERSRAVIMSSTMADAALGTLRPRLVKTRPPRYLTLQRIFVHPFEDLLVVADAGAKQFARIPRRALGPVWEFVLSRLDKAALQQLETSLRASPAPEIGAHHDPRISRFGETLWGIAAGAMRAELQRADKDAAHKAALEKELGDPTLLLELGDIAAMLELAEPLQRLREEMSPKPVGRLLDEQIAFIREIFGEVAAGSIGQPGYLIALVISRLTDGFQALPIFDGLADLPTGISGMNPGQFARAMLTGDSKRFLSSVSRTDPEKVPDSRVADMVGDFSSLVARLKKDGMADGAQAEIEAATRQLKQMVQVGVLGGIDAKVLGGVAAVLTPPPGDDPEATKQAVFDAKLDAENRVFALQRVAKVAGDIGAEKDVTATLKDLTQQIESTGATLVADIKAGKLNAEGRDAAKAKLFAALRMLELVAGSANATKLMKDGMAAIAKMPG